MSAEKQEFNSLAEAARYARIGRQAIYLAILKNQLKAEKKMVPTKKGAEVERWVVRRDDIDEYRRSKYNREKRMVDGEKLFDIEHDRWSVLHASKALSSMLKRPYPTHHLYYLLRRGSLRGQKKGSAWIIKREDLLKIFMKETKKNPDQLEMV